MSAYHRKTGHFPPEPYIVTRHTSQPKPHINPELGRNVGAVVSHTQAISSSTDISPGRKAEISGFFR